MKKTLLHLSAILLLCAPLAKSSQETQRSRANLAQANDLVSRMGQTIRSRDSKWKLKYTTDSWESVTQGWRAGDQELTISIHVYDSAERASRDLEGETRASSVARGKKLEGLGDEAFYMSHPYFSWVGVRKGRTVVTVHGPGPGLKITRRFAEYALAEINAK